jgi:hypothetical protein
MHSIQLESNHISSNGRLEVDLPSLQDTDVDVIIAYQPSQDSKKHQWFSDFISTFGAWQGEPMVRAYQEEQEKELFLEFYGCIQDDSFIRNHQNE